MGNVGKKLKIPVPTASAYTPQALGYSYYVEKSGLTHFEYFYQQVFENKEFVNKDVTSLKDFIINEEINEYDLHKLAQLNEIKLQMGAGWYGITIELVQKLDQLGWGRKVGSIKEKFGELRFYAGDEKWGTDHKLRKQCHEIIDHYTEYSKTVCEKCGEPGELMRDVSWHQTLCETHAFTPKEEIE